MPDPSDREERIFNRFRRTCSSGSSPTASAGRSAASPRRCGSRPGVESLKSRRSEEDYPSFGDVADAMREGDELIASMKPDVEHWFLDTIATDPDHHGEGLGGRLLDHDLAIRDAAGDACALDTHTADNIAFYGRRGFEIIGEGQLRGGPPVFVMFTAQPPQLRQSDAAELHRVPGANFNLTQETTIVNGSYSTAKRRSSRARPAASEGRRRSCSSRRAPRSSSTTSTVTSPSRRPTRSTARPRSSAAT